jgi:hypothetical protein
MVGRRSLLEEHGAYASSWSAAVLCRFCMQDVPRSAQARFSQFNPIPACESAGGQARSVRRVWAATHHVLENTSRPPIPHEFRARNRTIEASPKKSRRRSLASVVECGGSTPLWLHGGDRVTSAAAWFHVALYSIEHPFQLFFAPGRGPEHSTLTPALPKRHRAAALHGASATLHGQSSPRLRITPPQSSGSGWPFVSGANGRTMIPTRKMTHMVIAE